MRCLHRRNRRLARFNAVQEIPPMLARHRRAASCANCPAATPPSPIPDSTRRIRCDPPTPTPRCRSISSPWQLPESRRQSSSSHRRDTASLPCLIRCTPPCTSSPCSKPHWQAGTRRTFHLRRACAIEPQPPVRNVPMVADPIHQLSAARVVVPAPVLVNAHVNVRFHLRRPQPSVKVEIGRRRRHCQVPCACPGHNLCGTGPVLPGNAASSLHQCRQLSQGNHGDRPAIRPRRASPSPINPLRTISAAL